MPRRQNNKKKKNKTRKEKKEEEEKPCDCCGEYSALSYVRHTHDFFRHSEYLPRGTDSLQSWCGTRVFSSCRKHSDQLVETVVVEQDLKWLNLDEAVLQKLWQDAVDKQDEMPSGPPEHVNTYRYFLGVVDYLFKIPILAPTEVVFICPGDTRPYITNVFPDYYKTVCCLHPFADTQCRECEMLVCKVCHSKTHKKLQRRLIMPPAATDMYLRGCRLFSSEEKKGVQTAEGKILSSMRENFGIPYEFHDELSGLCGEIYSYPLFVIDFKDSDPEEIFIDWTKSTFTKIRVNDEQLFDIPTASIWYPGTCIVDWEDGCSAIYWFVPRKLPSGRYTVSAIAACFLKNDTFSGAWVKEGSSNMIKYPPTREVNFFWLHHRTNVMAWLFKFCEEPVPMDACCAQELTEIPTYLPYEKKVCSTCSGKASSKCCGCVYYCSSRCQREHRSSHKPFCKA